MLEQNKTITMKTLKINKLILLLIGFVVFTGCVEDDDFNTPNLSIVEPNITETQKRQISSVAGELAQAQGGGSLDYNDENTTYLYNFNDNDIYMEGFVVSTDEGGNFFKELIIQDKAENPTIGIKVLVDVTPLFVRYEVGRKVFIKLNGLSVGITNGVLTLGVLDGNRVGRISPAVENEYILRSAEKATIVPLPMEFADFSNSKTNLLVALEDVQFNRNQALGDNPLSYASEGFDQFDGERTLETCATGSSVIFSTSTFADFKGLTLPSGRGSMNAVLTKNFFGDAFNVSINSPEDINFDSAERCDPEFLECSGPSGGGSVIFEEDFEGFGTFASEGWDNINVSGTGTDWFISSFSGNFYSRISAFSSGNSEADVWLVTPPINLDNTTGEQLSFDLEAAFDTGTILSVYVSTDYSGDPTTATWEILDATIPVGPSGGFGGLQPVGPINISCVEGTAVFGFFYEGSDPSATTRYHLDNVKVTGN